MLAVEYFGPVFEMPVMRRNVAWEPMEYELIQRLSNGDN